ncbi:MAG: F0F1 ATP synthase subunit gamma [Nitrospirota bacterium]
MFALDVLRRKIQGAEDMHGIVKTMKTLAMVNIRNYQKAVESISEYYHTIELGFTAVLKQVQIEISRNVTGDSGKTVVVIFGSDQGLCGGFNDRIVEYAMQEMYESNISKKQKIVLCVGQRSGMLLALQAHPIEDIFKIPSSLTGITPVVQQMLLKLDSLRSEQKIERIIMFHNALTSNVSYSPRTVNLLPLDEEWYLEMKKRKWKSHILPTFSMDSHKLMSALIRQYVFVSLYRGFIESMASENAGRLASMQAAERNIEEKMIELQTSFRNLRQDSITSETLDIVSGYEALLSNQADR